MAHLKRPKIALDPRVQDNAARLERDIRRFRQQATYLTVEGLVEVVHSNLSYDVRVPGRAHPWSRLQCVVPSLELQVGTEVVVGFDHNNPDLAVIVAARGGGGRHYVAPPGYLTPPPGFWCQAGASWLKSLHIPADPSNSQVLIDRVEFATDSADNHSFSPLGMVWLGSTGHLAVVHRWSESDQPSGVKATKLVARVYNPQTWDQVSQVDWALAYPADQDFDQTYHGDSGLQVLFEESTKLLIAFPSTNDSRRGGHSERVGQATFCSVNLADPLNPQEIIVGDIEVSLRAYGYFVGSWNAVKDESDVVAITGDFASLSVIFYRRNGTHWENVAQIDLPQYPDQGPISQQFPVQRMPTSQALIAPPWVGRRWRTLEQLLAGVDTQSYPWPVPGENFDPFTVRKPIFFEIIEKSYTKNGSRSDIGIEQDFSTVWESIERMSNKNHAEAEYFRAGRENFSQYEEIASTEGHTETVTNEELFFGIIYEVGEIQPPASASWVPYVYTIGPSVVFHFEAGRDIPAASVGVGDCMSPYSNVAKARSSILGPNNPGIAGQPDGARFGCYQKQYQFLMVSSTSWRTVGLRGNGSTWHNTAESFGSLSNLETKSRTYYGEPILVDGEPDDPYAVYAQDRWYRTWHWVESRVWVMYASMLFKIDSSDQVVKIELPHQRYEIYPGDPEQPIPCTVWAIVPTGSLIAVLRGHREHLNSASELPRVDVFNQELQHLYSIMPSDLCPHVGEFASDQGSSPFQWALAGENDHVLGQEPTMKGWTPTTGPDLRPRIIVGVETRSRVEPVDGTPGTSDAENFTIALAENGYEFLAPPGGVGGSSTSWQWPNPTGIFGGEAVSEIIVGPDQLVRLDGRKIKA